MSKTPHSWDTVAVLSDIHGVLPALDAVLTEPDVAAAERIVLTGDIAAGPQPVEVLDRLVELGERVVWVGGNADRELVECACGGNQSSDPVSAWAAGQLRQDQVELLASLAKTARAEVGDLGVTVFCHATPRDDKEVVVVDSRLDRWAEVHTDLDPSVTTVVCGHTHMPYARLANGRLVVNPGSVGMPYGRSGAHWALLGKGATLRRTTFDRAAAARELARTVRFDGIEEWLDDYLRGQATDAEALDVMAPRDGR